MTRSLAAEAQITTEFQLLDDAGAMHDTYFEWESSKVMVDHPFGDDFGLVIRERQDSVTCAT